MHVDPHPGQPLMSVRSPNETETEMRILPVLAAAAIALTATGCAVVPAGPAPGVYGPGYGGAVVVAPPVMVAPRPVYRPWGWGYYGHHRRHW